MCAQALIGYSGFVGSNLEKQYNFTHKYNSANIHEINNGEFDLIVCAGVRSVKWWANENEHEDLTQIQSLMSHLSKVHSKKFVLISTIDVYPIPFAADETTTIAPEKNHPYGRNRFIMEQFVQKNFEKSFIVRLPALFGDGLKKNVLFDLLNRHRLEYVQPESKFQYYNLNLLWLHITQIISQNVPMVNCVTEPMQTKILIEHFFSHYSVGSKAAPPVYYDVHTRYSGIFGAQGKYIQDENEILHEIGNYIAISS